MKKIVGFVSLALAIGLSGCGGDSDSSGPSFTSSYKVVLGNQNEYSCPSVSAKEKCISDNTCSAAKCDLTTEVTPIVNDGTNTIKNCKVTNNAIVGYNNETCLFKNTVIDANIEITCLGSHMILDGHIGDYIANNKKVVSGTTIDAYWINCP